jgi:hypothetical protein
MTAVLISGNSAICAARTSPPRTRSDDQDVDVLREASGPLRDERMRVLDERVSGSVSVEIELHRSPPQRRSERVAHLARS